MPEWRSNFIGQWVLQEAMARNPEEYGLAPAADAGGEPMAEPPAAGTRRSARTADTVRAVIADATGENMDDFDFSDLDAVGDLIANDLTDPQAAFAALDAALQRSRLDPRYEGERATPGESSRAYVVANQAWREERGIPMKQDQNTKPSRSPERRRLERMRAKARRLGITVEEADAMTPRLPDDIYGRQYPGRVRSAK
jgi:hypothetical protein